ncbi:murein L,D-transpeptidase catalytic domain family protein [Inquilinus limosus]|uniref:murein L,D-transpeptidase catalytic domain family protein n=1 Tax=Inquilinus limosus TaxID=171674 RepID=UPI001C531AB8|nr:murein L,D-transpeptidase catalytic domain family protein [Inquilinus limosus]
MNVISIPALLIISSILLAPQRTIAAEPVPDVPDWLRANIGAGEGQIAGVVLQRARALYLQKVNEGVVKNPCYFAMDATRPGDPGNGSPGRRFYVICEAERSFRAISAGHGSGRNLKGVADFANGRQCAKNFSNALDSELTTGGAYVTAETKDSFKGYYRVSPGHDAALVRSFVQFDGEGETANARQRAIGGHAAQVLRGMCLQRNPGSPYATQDGYVPVGDLVDYTAGRSNGCTSWSPSDARQIITMLSDNPTTLYIYPESRDIDAVARAVATGRPLSQAGLYWNASCLKQIGSPKFWPRATLEPIIARYQEDHPAAPPRSLPICAEP